jgi:Mrp family chromosome partitioning ATPase
MANTELMKITVEHPEAETAARTANQVAAILIREGSASAAETAQNTQKLLVSALEQSKSELDEARQVYYTNRTFYGDSAVEATLAKQTYDLKQKIYENLLDQHQQSQIREAIQTQTLTVLDPALPPKRPFQPNPQLNLMLGVVLGLIGGIGLAFLFENLVSTPVQAKPAYQLPEVHPAAALPLATLHTPPVTIPLNSSDDTFRRLYQVIWDKELQNRRKKILILGVEPDNDKAVVAFQLACTVAQTGQRVVLVDSDFQRPAIHQLFNLPNQYGFGSLLTQNSDLKNVTWINKDYSIHLIPSGPAPYNATDFINSVQMDNVLKQLTTQYDVVLLNGPALGDKVDVTALASKADGLVIVSADEGHWREREPMVRLLFAQLGVPLLAVVRRQSSGHVHAYSAQNHVAEHSTNGVQRLFQSA